MSAQGPIDRTPGRLVVIALICLYASIFLFMLGGFLMTWSRAGRSLMELSSLPAVFPLPLVLIAILMRLTAPK